MNKSLTDFLRTAMEPVGSTMYIWGGGWNSEDSGAGKDAKIIGVNPNWKKFCMSQGSDYDYKEHRYEHRNVLDCSGYVGWVMYNFFEDKNGAGSDYVTNAKNQGKLFAEMGLGKHSREYSEVKPGDIMTSNDHVYIVIGECTDGSILFVHSSPPGVQICGTPAKSGLYCSCAVELAKKYTQKCFPEWYKKFSNCRRGMSYLTDFSRFRWYPEIMPDTDELYLKTPGEILEIILRKG